MRGKRRLGYEMVVIAIVILAVVIALVLFFGRKCKSAFSVAGDAMTGSSRQAECRAAGEMSQTSAKNWGRIPARGAELVRNRFGDDYE